MRAISELKRSRSRRSIDWSAVSFQRPRDSVALGALDQLHAGVIIADHGGQVIEMNRAAESIVQLEDGLNIRNGRLCARRAFETTKVIKLIVGATADTRSG